MLHYLPYVFLCFLFFSGPGLLASDDLDSFTREVIKEYKILMNKKYILIPYQDTFILPFSYNDNPNRMAYESVFDSSLKDKRGSYVEHLEAQFQLSFLILTNQNIFDTNFSSFIGYTHQAWWQVYNDSWSRPFRENNYMPEFFVRHLFDEPPNLGSLNLLAYDFGIVHHSNGQIQELSKSWNRVFVRYMLTLKRFVFTHRIWWRIPENKDNDDNPDILKYLGYNNISVSYNAGMNQYKLKVNLGEKYHGAELTYSYPWKEGLRFFVKAYHGYGVSLIDYNNETRSISMGISLDNPYTAKAQELEKKESNREMTNDEKETTPTN